VSERVEVRVGQIWQDCDKRFPDRHVRVVRIEGDYAFVVHAYSPSRETRIRLDRMRPTSTGFRLLAGEERTK
jgi:hypothetical protein